MYLINVQMITTAIPGLVIMAMVASSSGWFMGHPFFLGNKKASGLGWLLWVEIWCVERTLHLFSNCGLLRGILNSILNRWWFFTAGD